MWRAWSASVVSCFRNWRRWSSRNWTAWPAIGSPRSGIAGLWAAVRVTGCTGAGFAAACAAGLSITGGRAGSTGSSARGMVIPFRTRLRSGISRCRVGLRPLLGAGVRFRLAVGRLPACCGICPSCRFRPISSCPCGTWFTWVIPSCASGTMSLGVRAIPARVSGPRTMAVRGLGGCWMLSRPRESWSASLVGLRLTIVRIKGIPLASLITAAGRFPSAGAAESGGFACLITWAVENLPDAGLAESHCLGDLSLTPSLAVQLEDGRVPRFRQLAALASGLDSSLVAAGGSVRWFQAFRQVVVQAFRQAVGAVGE